MPFTMEGPDVYWFVWHYTELSMDELQRLGDCVAMKNTDTGLTATTSIDGLVEAWQILVVSERDARRVPELSAMRLARLLNHYGEAIDYDRR